MLKNKFTHMANLTPFGLWLRRQIEVTNVYRASDVPWFVSTIRIGTRAWFGLEECLDCEWRYALRVSLGIAKVNASCIVWREPRPIFEMPWFKERM